MNDNVELSMSLPLDSAGFLRRECPTCEREFKWLPSELADGELAPDGGYFCPYCCIQAPANAWFTKMQLGLAEEITYREVVAPELRKLERDLKKMERKSGGFIKAGMKFDTPRQPEPLTEQDDMRRVDFSCHPQEPVKVMESWDRSVHCLICGTEAGV